MACQVGPLFAKLSEFQINDNFDDDVRRDIMGMKPPHKALLKSQGLEEEGNMVFKTNAYSWLLIYMKNLCSICACLFLIIRVKLS